MLFSKCRHLIQPALMVGLTKRKKKLFIGVFNHGWTHHLYFVHGDHRCYKGLDCCIYMYVLRCCLYIRWTMAWCMRTDVRAPQQYRCHARNRFWFLNGQRLFEWEPGVWGRPLGLWAFENNNVGISSSVSFPHNFPFRPCNGNKTRTVSTVVTRQY